MNASLLALVLLQGQAAKEPATFTRTYRLNEVDTYRATSAVEFGAGTLNIDFKMKQTVKQVFQAGDAEIEFHMLETKMRVGNENLPGTSAFPFRLRMDKHGMQVGESRAETGQIPGIELMRLAMLLPNKPLPLGQDVPFEMKTSKGSVSGPMKLTELKDGVAKVTTQYSIQNTGFNRPIRLDVVSSIDTATHKVNKVEGAAYDLPSGELEIKSIKFTIEREKE